MKVTKGDKMRMRRRTIYAGAATVAALALAGAGIATASNGNGATVTGSIGSGSPAQEVVKAPDCSGSRIDDGADLPSQAKITERGAIAAAQTAVSGPLSEVDLEDCEGQLVFNVDVGSHDVKVDAASGEVLAAPQEE